MESLPRRDTGWIDNVFPIRCRDKVGCAVAVAPDTLVSVYHIAKSANATISLSSGPISANVTHPPRANASTNDGAVVKIPGGQLPSMRVRAPVYYEPVTLYGLRTRVKQRGFISGARSVSLMPEAVGVATGDSGGAVVADDGCLVGLISGHENDYPHVVLITRLDYLMPYIPKPRQAATGAMKPGEILPISMQSTSGLPDPVGSVFPPQEQPSAFDPPAPAPTPAVNRNQASCAAPRQEPVYSNNANCVNGQCTVPLRRGRVRRFR